MSTGIYDMTDTWTAGGTTYTAVKMNVTDTASAAASLLMDLQVGSSSKFKVSKGGMITSPLAGSVSGTNPQNNIILYGGFSGYGIGFGANGDLAVVINSAFRASVAVDVVLSSAGAHIWTNSTQASDTKDTSLVRAAANSVRWGGGTPTATTTSRTEINKAVASIADNTATATFTVTVPNAAHSAMLKVTLVGSLGAGGAVGANEATGTISYDFAIARTAGVDTVVTASTAYGSSTSSVAGAATITVSAAASAMTGASSATQTFTINVTIARGSGSSANHTCLCYGRLLNANATGVTIA